MARLLVLKLIVFILVLYHKAWPLFVTIHYILSYHTKFVYLLWKFLVIKLYGIMGRNDSNYHVECNSDLSKNSHMQSIRCSIHSVTDSVSVSNPFSPFYYLRLHHNFIIGYAGRKGPWRQCNIVRDYRSIAPWLADDNECDQAQEKDDGLSTVQ
jgi:hypothetical protein